MPYCEFCGEPIDENTPRYPYHCSLSCESASAIKWGMRRRTHNGIVPRQRMGARKIATDDLTPWLE